MTNWTNEPQPFGANHVPLLTGLSSVDGITPVPVAVVPSTGAVVTSGGGGGGGGSVTQGTVPWVDNITQIGGSNISLGQTTKSASIPVTLASDTGTLPVSLTSTTITGTVTVSGTVTSNIGTTNGLALDATLTGGNQQVQGNIPSGSTDSGNPVKIGGRNNTTKPTLADGQRGDVQLDTRGNTQTSLWVGNTNTTANYQADNSDTVASTATANKLVVVSRGTIYNGTTWDRMYGDSTNGIWVNIKSAVLPTGASTSAQQISTVSTNNSSTATLTSGSVFTGTADDASGYGEFRVSVFSDQASATNGLSIQQSSDSTNWDIIDTYTIAASTGKTFVVPRSERYVRVVYTNGGTNQGVFRLQSILNRVGTSMSSQRSQDGYTNETDLQEIWSFNSVWNGTTWDRAPGDTTGARVKQAADTATLTNVAGSASSVTLLSANTARIGATITNDSSAVVYIKFGTTASTTSYTVSLAGAAAAPFSYYEVPGGYRGRIDAIWASATGNARITEIS